MIKHFIFIFWVTIPIITYSQININSQLPFAGFVQKEQLWNMVLVNNNPQIAEVNIKCTVQDKLTGQIILSAITGNIYLNKGIKQISYMDLQPIVYNYNNISVSKKYLPLGTYIVCYQVNSGGSKPESLVEDCKEIVIEPLSPPMLTLPQNKSEIQTTYPQFVWMPPTPIESFSNLHYNLIVAEIKEGQSAIEAIRYNAPVYTKSNIIQTIENYPPSLNALAINKEYAWQVIVKNNEDYNVSTETWSFKVVEDPINKIISLAPFLKITDNLPQISIVHQGMLKLEINNELNDSIGTFTVTNSSNNKQKKEVCSFVLSLKPGVNFIQESLSKYAKLNLKDVYQVQYINSKGIAHFIKFKAVYYK